VVSSEDICCIRIQTCCKKCGICHPLTVLFLPAPGSNAGLNEREALQRQMQMQQDAYQAEMAKLDGFWQQQTDAIADIDPQTADFKAMELPLARVKKIMRLEDDLKVTHKHLSCKYCAGSYISGCYSVFTLLPVSTVTHIASISLREQANEAGAVRFMISSDAPVMLAKASELFIRELSLRASTYTEEVQ
jgi:hypothetical protein